MRPVVGRLKRRAEFLRVASVRRKWATPGLILQAAPYVAPKRLPAGPEPFLRLGFTCSKKVGNAVERNRARRRLRAAAAELMPDLAAGGRDYVLIGRSETIRRPYSLLLKDLRQALRRLGALRETSPDSSGAETV